MNGLFEPKETFHGKTFYQNHAHNDTKFFWSGDSWICGDTTCMDNDGATGTKYFEAESSFRDVPDYGKASKWNVVSFGSKKKKVLEPVLPCPTCLVLSLSPGPALCVTVCDMCVVCVSKRKASCWRRSWWTLR